ncbi:MAG: glycosyltransferase [Acidobacteria bacterium]|nr:glycosyltransferase [Acidobacteriota bacterium]
MVLAWVLAALLAGSIVYSVLAILAARNFLHAPPPPPAPLPPVSVLRPLAGADSGLERNLRSTFEQDYPAFEILFATRNPADPARAVAERLMGQYPHVPARFILTGEPPYANAKVFSLDTMAGAAAHDLLVMIDSDMYCPPGFLRQVASEFADPRVGMSTCPYRAIPVASFWSRLEALGMNTHFFAGIFTARLLEGMRFTLGPTSTIRRQTLEQVGGWNAFREYLAEDFVIGQRVAQAGWTVVLSQAIPEHHIGGGEFRENLTHRVRWARSTRRSRPWGYTGEVFTQPLPFAIAAFLGWPMLWPLAAAALTLRAVLAYMVATRVLGARLSRADWMLLWIEDAARFAFWLSGYFGNRIVWRGRTYRLNSDGRFDFVG